MSVLLIDDSESDAEFTIRALKKTMLITVLHFIDGIEAMTYLTSKKCAADTLHVPKVIIMDLKMPRVSGLDLLRFCKDDSGIKKIPIVMFSSSGEHTDITECLMAGANSYLVKPVGYTAFSTQVGRLADYWLKVNTVIPL